MTRTACEGCQECRPQEFVVEGHLDASPWTLMKEEGELRNTIYNVCFYAIPLIGNFSKWMDWLSTEEVKGSVEEKIHALRKGQMEDLAWMIAKVISVAIFILPHSFMLAVGVLSFDGFVCHLFYNGKEDVIKALNKQVNVATT